MDLRELGGYLVLLFSLGVMLWGIRDIWRPMRILAGLSTAAAVVVNTRTGAEGEVFTTLRFRTMDNAVVEFEQWAPGGQVRVFGIKIWTGSLNDREYKVFYDPTHPARATATPIRDLVNGAVMIGLGCAFFIGLLANLP